MGVAGEWTDIEFVVDVGMAVLELVNEEFDVDLGDVVELAAWIADDRDADSIAEDDPVEVGGLVGFGIDVLELTAEVDACAMETSSSASAV